VQKNDLSISIEPPLDHRLDWIAPRMVELISARGNNLDLTDR
jgi:hypothetical protein